MRDAPDGALVVDDPITGHRTHLGTESATVFIALSAGHDTPAALCAAAPGLDAALIRDRLAQMRDALLLEGDRWQAQQALFTAALPRKAPEDLPVEVHKALRHRCVRCGSSCLGAGVGPVGEATEAAIAKHRLWQGVPGVESADALLMHAPGGPFVRTIDDACGLLREGAACAAHAAAGAAAKPGGCQQFPYLFAVGPDAVYAGLQMECRSFPAALRQGNDWTPAALGADLATGLAAAPGVEALPDPVALAPGLFAPLADWMADWRVGLSVIEGADDAFRALDALTAIAHQRIEARATALGPDPAWLRDPFWPAAPIDAEALRRALPGQVMAACAWLTHEAARSGAIIAQEQAELARKAAVVALGGGRLPPTEFADAAGPALLHTALLGEWFGHRPILGADLLYGLGRLRLSLTLTEALARLRAAQAARRIVRVDDVNDALVIVGQTLRAGVVEQTLRAAQAAVRALALPGAPFSTWMGRPHPGLSAGGVTVT